MRSFWVLFGVSLAITSPARASGPFDGTWKADLKTAEMSKTPDVVLLKDGIYTCSTCVPVFAVAADGASHPMTGFPYFDEAAVTVVDARTIGETDKLKGKVVSTSTTKLSTDGGTLTTDWVDLSAPDGKPVSGQVMQERVAPAPAGAHATSGSWRTRTIGNISDSALTMTFATSGDMFSMKTPSGYGYDAKVGGPPTPFTGDTANTMIVVTQPSPMTIVETDTRDGKPTARYTMTAVPGGRSLRVLSENLQKGTHTSYMMLKQ